MRWAGSTFRHRCVAALVVVLLTTCSRGPGQAGPSRGEITSLFEPGHSVSVAVAAGYDAQGFRGAIAAYREYRKSCPPARLYHMWPAPARAVAAARKVMQEGVTIGSYPPLPVRFPMPWAADPHRDKSWRYSLNSLAWLTPVVQAYEETGDSAYLVFAVSVVVDWHEQNVRHGLSNPLAWYDMAVGLRAPLIAFLVDAAARSSAVSDEDLWALLETAARHARELRDPRKYAGDYNHGLYQMLGLLVLARTLPELRDFPEYEEYAKIKAERIFITSFSREGVHLEHSPGYQLVVLRTLEAVLDQELLDTERLRRLHQSAQEALAWMVHPTGQLAAFGDTGLLFPSERYLRLNAPHRNPHLLWVLTKGKRGRPFEQLSWVAPEGGYAFFRSSWTPGPGDWEKVSYLAMHAGRHSKYHKHADDLTFEWTEFGQPILVDSGPFKYWEDDPRRQYCRSTRAHNTVEIDEKDYWLPSNSTPRPRSGISRWVGDQPVRVVEAEVIHFDSVRHRRTLFFCPREWVLVVDELCAPEPHSYTQWFHFHPRLNVTAGDDCYEVDLPGTATDLYVAPLGPTRLMSRTLVRGQKEPRLQGWTSLETSDDLTPNWAIGFRSSGQQVRFATLLLLGATTPRRLPESSAVSIDDRAIRVAWSYGGARTAVLLERASADLKVTTEREPTQQGRGITGPARAPLPALSTWRQPVSSAQRGHK